MANRRLLICLLLCSSSALQPSSAEALQDRATPLVPIEGPRRQGRLVSIDSAWNITIDTGQRREVLSVDDLFSWGHFRDGVGHSIILLTNQSQLAADVLGIDDRFVHVQSRTWQTIRLPIECVEGILLQPPLDLQQKDQLIARIQQAEGTTDQLILRNGDQLEGFLTPPESLESDPSSEPTGDWTSIEFEVDSNVVTVSRDVLVALIFNPSLALQPPVEKAVWVGMKDGSRLACRQMIPYRDGLQLLLPGDIELKTDPALGLKAAWRQIEAIQPISDRYRFVADLENPRYQHQPLLSMQRSFQKNRHVLGGQLRFGQRVYLHGIGMPSDANLVYSLTKPARRFEAEAAIDRSAGRGGSVRFRVFVSTDGQTWESRYRSPVVRADHQPIPIQVDLQGARAIALAVESADRGSVQDYANWLNARIVP